MESNEVGVRSGQMRSFVWSLSVIHDSALTLIIIIIYLSFFFSAGFVPTETGMNLLEPLALYLLLYRFFNGPGAVVPFPGMRQTYACTNTDSAQDITTKAEIYLSVVKPAEANGEAFNIADMATPSSWSMKWPMLTKYFGLEGAGPNENGWKPI